ncbi:MAG: LacI family transcriptional regulator, partial [Lentisphaerae bacterium]|nr:LacI family transcriptional regulator [Lentisphaerota bacterium]
NRFLTGVRQGADGRFDTIEPVALDFVKAHLDRFRGKPFLVHSGVLLDVVDGKGVLNSSTLALLREALNPIMYDGFDCLEGVSQLIFDLHDGFHRLVDHMAAKHARIGCLMGYPGCVWFRPRLQGFLDGLYANRLDFNPEWLKITSGQDRDEDFRALDAMLKGPSRPTALICANDMRALHALDYSARHGIAVPGELAVAGSDNIPECAVSDPPLTTLDFQQAATGRLAADWLLKRLLGKLTEPTRKWFKPELIVRSST